MRKPPDGDLAARAPGPDLAHDRVHGEAERGGRGEGGDEPQPGRPHREVDRGDQRRVEEHTGVVRRRGRVEHLARGDDRDRPDDHPGEAPRAAEDHDRVDQDQHLGAEVLREGAGLRRGEDASGEAGDRGAEAERHDLQPVDRHPHQLGGERILARGLPGPAGPRLADQVEHDHHDDHAAEQEPVVALRRRDREVAAEGPERERVDVREPVRAVREPVRVGRCS